MVFIYSSGAGDAVKLESAEKIEESSRVLFIDNFDSFVYNLIDEFRKRYCNVAVYRNNVPMSIIDSVVENFKPDFIAISPGPSKPSDAGNSMEIIGKYYQDIPIFGVCLGHQCIAEVFGGKVDKSPELMHGYFSPIYHDNKTIYNGLDNPFKGGRYHSLSVHEVPESMEVSAWTETSTSKIIMGIRMKDYLVEGVQFHPESILTPQGGLIIQNLLEHINIYNWKRGL